MERKKDTNKMMDEEVKIGKKEESKRTLRNKGRNGAEERRKRN